MGDSLRARLAALASRLAVPAIEASGAVWDPRSGTIVRVRAADVALHGTATFRRLLVRLESRGAVAPGWLPLARYPDTLWQTDAAWVVFWLDGVGLPEMLALVEVLEELGWSALWTPPPGLDRGSSVGVLGGGIVLTDAPGGRWSTVPGVRGAYQLGAFRGHARPGADGAVGAVECGVDMLHQVPAWVLGDAAGAAKALVRNAVRRQVDRR